MDTRLDENETELGVLVLAVALEVLADGNSLQRLVSALHKIKISTRLAFLMSMYRSSGSSGARPVISLCQFMNRTEALGESISVIYISTAISVGLFRESYRSTSGFGECGYLAIHVSSLAPFSQLAVHLPVTILTWAIPWESRRMTPI